MLSCYQNGIKYCLIHALPVCQAYQMKSIGHTHFLPLVKMSDFAKFLLQRLFLNTSSIYPTVSALLANYCKHTTVLLPSNTCSCTIVTRYWNTTYLLKYNL